MSLPTDTDSNKLNFESLPKQIVELKQMRESVMKLRLEVAAMQMKILSLFEAPCFEILQLLIENPRSCQTNDQVDPPENNSENMQVVSNSN